MEGHAATAAWLAIADDGAAGAMVLRRQLRERLAQANDEAVRLQLLGELARLGLGGSDVTLVQEGLRAASRWPLLDGLRDAVR